MGWFKSICRNLGLMVHNISNPEKDETTTRKVIKKEVEEKIEGNVTLRRTTIEEVEIKKDDPKDPSDSNAQD